MAPVVFEDRMPAFGEPIAIVGIACRLPGENDTPDALWKFLSEKRTAKNTVPPSRFNIDSFYHPNPKRPGSIVSKGGYFLSEDVYEFDPTFFGIGLAEATELDPQQRKLLEVVYESFESAGATLEKMAGSKTACFVGNFTSDFKHMQTYDMEYSTAYSATGSGETLLSNRISHTFNLLGPSMTIDTACSSSMYALHLACSAIARGDADAAVIGGANLILGLSQQLVNSKLGVLSATSECHTFDARADGYGRADGVGAVYLKPLSAAIAAGDPIRGVIRGTAFNANGKTNGITNPSVAGQVEVIRHAYRQAGLSIDGTGYFECHGTGTPVGDPIEVEAIGRVFAAERSVDNPLLIGSIKSSLGHSEAVSGISSIIKTALILERGIITPAYGFDIPNPKIDFDGWRVKVVTENTPWPQGSIRRASVNSFGYGGSNAHCILESAASLVPGYTVARARESHPAYPDSYHQQPGQRGKFLLAFSAHSDATLDKQISNIHDVAQNYDPVDLAYTLGVRRSRFFYRAFAIGESGRSFAAGVTKANKSLKPPTLGFVFTGQGAQWPEMGVGLMDSFPFFLSCVQKYDGWLRELDDAPSWSIEGSLREPAETSRINEPELAQPICTAVQIALVDLLAEWNVRPIATIGHSSGEIAAAYASGHLSAREAIIVSYYRGLEVSRDTQKGAMMAVGLSASEVAKYITGSSITIACENSPESVTLSGVTEEIEGVYNRLKKEAKGVFCRVLKVGKAYHSSQMKTIGPVYKKRLRGYLGKKKRQLLERKIMASSVMAELVPEKTVLDASYWQKNLESPVLFHQALETLIQQVPEIDCLIELGPHSALAGPIRQITKSIGKGDKVTYLPTLSRGKDSAEDVLTLAGQLFLKDYPVDLEHVNAVQDRAGRTLVDLPRYGWTYGEPLKHEPRPSRELRNRKYPRHDLLGSRVLGGCTSEILWRNLLSVKNVPWLEDHQIGHEILFPAAGYVSMAAEALTQALDDNEPGRKDVAGYRFRELSFKAALALPTDGSVEIIFRIQPITTGTRGSIETYAVSAASLSNDKWVENFQATISPEVHPAESTVTPSLDLLTRQYPTKFWYDIMGKAGLHYGTTFKGLDNIRTYPGCSEATATTYTTITDAVMPNQSRYLVHPTVFDNCLQLGEIAALAGQVKNFHVGFIPVEIEELWLSTSGVSPDENRLDISSQGRTEGKIISADLQLRNSSNNLILDLKGVKCVPFEIRSSVPDRSPYCRAIWKPDTKILTLTQATSILCPGRNGMDQLLLDMRKLDRVLLLCVLLLYPRVRDITVTPTQPFLQDYLTWFKSLAQLALSGQVLKAFDTAQWSRDEQEAEFKKLLGEMTHVTEALLLERMYKHLPAILTGETSFLSIALEDNLLSRHYAEGLGFKGAQAQMAKALDLLAHENPTMDILEVGGGTGGSTKIALEVLRGGKHLKRYRTYTFTDITPGFLAAAQDRFENCSDMKYGTLNVEEDIENQDFEPGSYDLIVASNVLHATLSIKTTLKNIRRLLRPGGRLLLLETTRDQVYVTIVLGLLRDWWRGKLEGRYPTPFLSKEQWSESLKATGFSGADLILDDYPSPANTASIIVSTAVPEEPPVTSREELIVIVRDQPTPLSQAIETAAKAKNWNVTTQIFNASVIPKNARIISLVEVGQPLLADVDETSWLSLKRLISTSSSLLWVTSGNLIAGARPEYSLMLGLTRGIRLEEPHISLTNFDLEDENPDPAAAGELIVRMEERLRVKNQTQNEDVDFLVKGGVVHTCRFYPDEGLNEEFMQVVETREGKRFEPKSLGGWGNVKLKVGDYGLLDSLFLSEESVKDVLDPGAVEVEVKFWGLTAKSLAVVTGKSNSSTAMQGTGIVRRIGSAVESLKAGDEVVFVHPGNLEMVIQCREILCQKIQRGLEGTASVPVPYLTAQYGLQHLARLDRDEIVLIHFSFGGISEAAIQIALQIGSLVFVTVDSPSAYDYVTGKFGSQIRSIFSSPATFERDLNRATAGHGVDVVFGEAGLYESWRFLAPFGRLVQVGRGDRGDLEKVSTPRVVPGNASLLRVELAELVKCKPELAGRFLKDAISVLNSGSIRLPETTSFPPTELQAAFQHLSNATSTTLISYADKETTIVKVQPQQKQAHFDPTAWYLLVGCLGGLGISMTYWMLERGARNFVFLSRSGANSSRSVALLEDIKKKGGVAVAVKGDVTNINDVQRAIGSASGPIKGVVQGVMALRDSLFDSMTTDEYLSVIRPKMTGTFNLHNALLSAPLDFFFALSSIASQTGTATQANYCSANSFLDFFGRHREALGLPITALGLGMVLEVGHAADNPNVEEALSRSGVHSIYEHEFHQMLEVILRPRDTESEVPEQGQGQGHGGYDPLSRSLLVTGFEPGKLRDLLDQGFGGGTLWKTDPRLKMVFMAAVDAQRRQLDSSTPNSSSSNGGNGAGGEKANNVFNRLGALRGDAAIDFFQGIVSEQLSRLLLIPIEQLDVGKALANFGVDSMIDAELRNWLYKELRTEVSFVEIRASGTCIRSLAGRIVEAHGLGADAMDIDGPAVTNGNRVAHGNGTLKRKAEDAESANGRPEKQGKRI